MCQEIIFKTETLSDFLFLKSDFGSFSNFLRMVNATSEALLSLLKELLTKQHTSWIFQFLQISVSNWESDVTIERFREHKGSNEYSITILVQAMRQINPKSQKYVLITKM